MTYLAAAYGVFWALTFLYVYSIAYRQRRLQKEISALLESLEDEDR
jgi:CcmD family protein